VAEAGAGLIDGHYLEKLIKKTGIPGSQNVMDELRELRKELQLKSVETSEDKKP